MLWLPLHLALVGFLSILLIHACFIQLQIDRWSKKMIYPRKAEGKTDEKKKKGSQVDKSIFSHIKTADSLASPVRVQSFLWRQDIYTRKRTFTSIHAKGQKQKRLFFHRKDLKWTLYCGFTTSDLCSVVHLVINNGYCGKASKGLLRYIQGGNCTLTSWKSTYLNVSLIVLSSHPSLKLFDSHWHRFPSKAQKN